jgi:hypothetical protein
MDKLIELDMVAALWPQPYAGSVVQPETPLLRLCHWYFKPLSPPQAFNALVIDLPAGISQQSCDSTIPTSTILSDQFDHVCHKAIFIFAAPWSTSLRGPVLAKYATDTTFRQVQFAVYMINALTTTGGA